MRFSLAVLIVTAAPAFSQELPSGTYALQIDGGVGRAAVIGRLAKISIGGSGCAGGVTGVLASEAPDAWEINLDTDAGLCTVAVVRQPQATRSRRPTAGTSTVPPARFLAL
jgi:hypothetical protein